MPRAHEKARYFRYLFFAAGPVEQAIIANSMGWSVDPQKEGSLGFGSYERMVEAFEAMLTGRDYVCGDRFTMADVYVGSQVDWGLAFGTLPQRDAFAAYAERLRTREAYMAAKAIDNDLIAPREAAGAESRASRSGEEGLAGQTASSLEISSLAMRCVYRRSFGVLRLSANSAVHWPDHAARPAARPLRTSWSGPFHLPGTSPELARLMPASSATKASFD